MILTATDLDIIFIHQINNIEVFEEGKTTTTSAVMYDIVRKISSGKKINLTKEIELVDENKKTIGNLRSAVYSPRFKMIVGIAMINLEHCNVSQNFKININNKEASGSVCSLPMN